MATWTALTTAGGRDAAEALALACEALTPEPSGTGVFEIEDGSALWEVGAYFTEPPDQIALSLLAAAHGARPFAVSELPDVDWVAHVRRELTPVVAALAALADHTSHIRGVGHIRGHETDRLAALETELERLGAHVSQTDDGLTIHPKLLGGAVWRTYADHRMAQAGALLGLVVPDVELDDIGCTAKTMPEFPDLWRAML